MKRPQIYLLSKDGAARTDSEKVVPLLEASGFRRCTQTEYHQMRRKQQREERELKGGER